MQLGGSPSCTTCGRPVYHAEQIMGPGRRIYHKLCLKCVECGKRLDPGGLVEHDGQPHCARCHTQLYGTRDLRHANVLPSPSSSRAPTRPASHSVPSTPTPGATSVSNSPMTTMSPPPPRFPSISPATSTSSRPRPPATQFYTPPPASPVHLDDGNETAYDHAAPDPASPIPITRPNFRDARPISVPFAGGTKALDERGLLRRGDSPRSKVGERVVGDDACGGCGRRVYAAEMVVAIGMKWHKGCLRCTSCKSTVDPSKVSDREGQVYCKNCYSKLHGPGGIAGKR